MATSYVNPEIESVGGAGTPTDPFKLWSEVTWAVGNTYKQMRETVGNATITPDVAGTLGNEITIAAFANADGSDNSLLAKPVIDLEFGGNYGIDLNAMPHFRVNDFRAINCNLHGFFIQNPIIDSNIELTDLDSDDNIVTGYHLVNNPSTIASGIIYRRCNSNRSGQHGFHAIGSLGDNTIVAVRYYNCNADGSGHLGVDTATGGHGFSGWNATKLATSGWSGAGPVYSRDTAVVDDPTFVRCFRVYDQVAQVYYTENTGTPTTPAVGEWGYSGTTLYVNPGADPSTLNIEYVPKVVHFERYFCRATGTKTIPDGSEGVGFAYDDSSIGKNVGCIALRNEGLGFSLNKTQFVKDYSCISVGNHLDHTTPNEIQTNVFAGQDGWVEHYNCLIDNKGGEKCLWIPWYTDNFDVKNSILMNSDDGIPASAVGGGAHTADTNLFSAVTTNTSGASLTSTNETEGDPVFVDAANDDYHLQQTSPGVGTGVKYWGNGPRPIDADGQPYPDTRPDQGPYQSMWDVGHPENL